MVQPTREPCWAIFDFIIDGRNIVSKAIACYQVSKLQPPIFLFIYFRLMVINPMSVNCMEFNIEDIREQIAKHADDGALTQELQALLIKNGYAAPLEFEALDYKETVNDNKGRSRIIKSIISMYNTYGGYLVFGVGDARNGMGFPVVGIDESIINIEQLKDQVLAASGIRCVLSGFAAASATSQGEKVKIVIVHIPCRPDNEAPVAFTSDAKSDTGKNLEYKTGDFFYRKGDTTAKAVGQEIFWLAQPRVNPYLTRHGTQKLVTNKNLKVQHNLPDRAAICINFIRRDDVLNKLWEWSGDDLSHWRVIAGEGGIGKSSVAYEYAEQLIRYPDQPFDQILWLSAKSRRFDGYTDVYQRMPETHYSNFDELLSTLCSRLAYKDDEIIGQTQSRRKQLIKSGLTCIPTFLIIDDLDSLRTDEQKQVGELVAWLSVGKSRILITTRHNHLFSSSTSINLEGFKLDEFEEFLDAINKRIPQIETLSAKQRVKMHEKTHGSPLLAESVCRNLRYTNFEDAMNNWHGKNGEMARAAVLKKEVQQLTSTSKKVLVAAAMLRSASISEIASVTEYPKTSVEDSIDELDRLFLVARPHIAKEPRFAVNETTALLVLELLESLVPDFRKLQKAVDDLSPVNYEIKKEKYDSIVASSIRQANAFLTEGNITKALETLDSVHLRNNHPDILSFKTKVLYESSPQRLSEAKYAANSAYSAGCRKPHFFEIWFSIEWDLKDYSGAVDASNAAIKAHSRGEQEWYVRNSAALSSRAEERWKSEIEGSRRDLAAASKSMSEAIKLSTCSERQQWLLKLFNIHDRIVELNRTIDGTEWPVMQEEIEMMNKAGDLRLSLAWVAVNSIGRFFYSGKLPRGKEKFVANLIEKTRVIVDRRLAADNDSDGKNIFLISEWKRVCALVSDTHYNK